MENRLDMTKIDWSFLGLCKVGFYYLVLFITSTLSYAQVKKEVVLALALAMVFDTITGVAKSYRLGKKISSREGKRGILEKILMLSGLIVLAVVGRLLDIDLSWIVVNAFILLTVFETFSFFGNIGTIRTGKEMEELDAISMMIKFVRISLKSVIEKYLNDKK
jgi:phage-related holin